MLISILPTPEFPEGFCRCISAAYEPEPLILALKGGTQNHRKLWEETDTERSRCHAEAYTTEHDGGHNGYGNGQIKTKTRIR